MKILFYLFLILNTAAQAFSLRSASPTLFDPIISHIVAQTQNLNPEVLKLALKANACLQQSGKNKKNLLTILDYSLPSSKKRFWVIDLSTKKVVFSLCAAHGKGTGDHWAIHFSNKPESRKSSLGIFLTGKTYFGKHGLSMELLGLEPHFNSTAHQRRVVMHAAPYVSEAMVQKTGKIGRSWGCPALNPKFTQPVIDQINNGTLFFAYYPNNQWLEKSRFLNCAKY